MSQIIIKPVQTRRDRRTFIRLARQLNANRELWVPSLTERDTREISADHNPFYQHATAEFFVAFRGEQPVGRIAAIENQAHNEYWKDRIGFFGHYECVDDPEVSRQLFAAAQHWLSARGLHEMRGPTNPSMNANIGFLIDGFQYSPSIPMPYTQPYYPHHAEAFGLRKAMDVIVYGWDFDEYSKQHVSGIVERLTRLGQKVRAKNEITIRGPNLRDLANELEIIRSICNDSLADNWGFVPLTDDEIRMEGDELKQIIDPEMFSIAEVNGQAQAVFMACPDYNELLARMDGRVLPWGWLTYLRYRKRIRKYVVYVYATTQFADAQGVGVLLYEQYFNACLRKGIKVCETGYVLENNLRMRNTIENLGAIARKRYRIYEKSIR